MLTGEKGILTQATKAKEETEEAKIEELKKLTQIEAATHLENYEYIDNSTGEEKIVIIPPKCAVSLVEGENTLKNGLVIIDSNGNEWVWVPVEVTNVLYETSTSGVALSGNTGVTTNRYSASEIISGVTRGVPGSTDYREPDVVSSYDAVESNCMAVGFSSFTDMSQNMVDEYEKMIASIEKYEGFYIGRYELTTEGEKSGKTLTDTNWYNLYVKCKELTVDNKTTVSMIWGCQWDITCSWLASSGYNIEDSRSWGNYNDSTGNAAVTGYGLIQNTGYSDYWKANNIYDLAGNCTEWTQEVYFNNTRIGRGGNYSRSGDEGSVSAKNAIYPVGGDGARYTSSFNDKSIKANKN